MKYKILILIAIISGLIGCDDLQWELPRDNPLDNNVSNDNLPNLEFSRYEVYADNNNDDQINKGESIKLKVFIKNNGSSTANKVRGTISCASSYISSLSPTTAVAYTSGYYDYIDPENEGYPGSSSSYLSFNVSNTTPDGTIITFKVEITDESNNTWTDSFTITVVGTGASIGFSRYEVYADNNNDDQINKGESIKLKVFIKNNGSSTANKVRGTISCTSSYISSLSPTTAVAYTSGYYDYIDPGDEGYPGSSSSYLSFNVSNTTPDGTIITFNVTITDESNNTWTDSFTITVVATGASIGFSRYEVYADNNNDDQINKGESIKLKVFIKNNGSSTANKVRGTISCASSYISSLSPTTAVAYTSGYYDYIDPGDEGYPGSSSSYLSFNVSNTTPDGTIITFNIEITDESNNTWTDSFTITVVATGASIGFSRFDVYDDDNNDQLINPGESVKLKVYLINNGSSTANKVRGTISCTSSYISSLSPTTAVAYTSGYYDYIDPGDEGYPGSSSSYLSFNVSGSTPTGSIITFNLSITDESDNNWSDNFSITVY